MAIEWEGWRAGTFCGSCTYTASIAFYLDPVFARQWFGKASGDYGGAEDP